MTKEIVSLEQLAERVKFFERSSISASTRRAYETDWTNFFQWCKAQDLEHLPASPETIQLYISSMADRNLSISTIVRRLTSITAIHEAAGHESPSQSAAVRRVLKGIKRDKWTDQKTSRAISWRELQKMAAACDSTMIGRRDAAILLLGWSSALRRSELVALNIGDLDFQDEGLVLHVRSSKTDQEGRGCKIGIPIASSGLCPVHTVRQWIERRTASKLPADAPLFPKVGAHGRGKWWYSTQGRLSARCVALVVKRYAREIGLDWRECSAHSLRRGFATEAAAAGVPERVISRHTRHRSIKTLRGYIEDGTIWTDNPLPSVYSSSPCSIPSGDQ